MSDESRGILETYAQGIADADRMLKKLADHFAATKEPTMIVFFGDHLPSLGDNMSVYTDTKYISGYDDPDFFEKMYSVPFVIWDNFLPPQPETLRFSTSFLGPYVLHRAGIRGTYYTDFLYDLSQRIPIIPPESSYEAFHIAKSDLEEYKQLQYDILFGKRYAYEARGLKGRIIDPHYELGDGDIVIESVSPNHIGQRETEHPRDGKPPYSPGYGGKLSTPVAGSISGGEAVAGAAPTNAAGAGGAMTGADSAAASIIVAGRNFVPGCAVFANGRPLPTAYRPDGTLSADIPGAMLRQPGTLAIEVRLTDEKRVVIAKSNKYEVRVK